MLPTVRHTKYGRIRGMVVGEGGRLSGVLLYRLLGPTLFRPLCPAFSFADVDTYVTLGRTLEATIQQ